MEMEVGPYGAPKRLHHHVMPIVIVAIAIAVISTPYLIGQSMPRGGGAALMHDLSTRPLQARPTIKSSAPVTLNHNQAGYILSPEVGLAGQTSYLLLQLSSPKL